MASQQPSFRKWIKEKKKKKVKRSNLTPGINRTHASLDRELDKLFAK